jgi:hypothetical protein
MRKRLIGTTASRGRSRPTEQQMKLTDLFFSRARKRAPSTGGIETPSRVGNRAGSDMIDRSSMADLVRLLKEADDAQTGGGHQPA